MSAGIVDTEREQQTAANAPPPGTLPNRLLERLRAAINWGMARTPPLLAKSSFHSFGVRLNNKAEVSRDRRIPRDEEKRLLDTSLGKMNAPEHQFAEAAKCRFAKARPEPDFRYFSNRRAALSSRNASDTTRDHGR